MTIKDVMTETSQETFANAIRDGVLDLCCQLEIVEVFEATQIEETVEAEEKKSNHGTDSEEEGISMPSFEGLRIP